MQLHTHNNLPTFEKFYTDLHKGTDELTNIKVFLFPAIHDMHVNCPGMSSNYE